MVRCGRRLMGINCLSVEQCDHSFSKYVFFFCCSTPFACLHELLASFFRECWVLSNEMVKMRVRAGVGWLHWIAQRKKPNICWNECCDVVILPLTPVIPRHMMKESQNRSSYSSRSRPRYRSRNRSGDGEDSTNCKSIFPVGLLLLRALLPKGNKTCRRGSCMCKCGCKVRKYATCFSRRASTRTYSLTNWQGRSS